MNTISKSPRRTRRSRASPTSARSTSCLAPPCFVSTAVTLSPRARSRAGRSRSPPGPAKTTSAPAHGSPLGARHDVWEAQGRSVAPGASRFVEPPAVRRSPSASTPLSTSQVIVAVGPRRVERVRGWLLGARSVACPAPLGRCRLRGCCVGRLPRRRGQAPSRREVVGCHSDPHGSNRV